MARSNENKYQIDMCNGPILKKILTFAIPLMFSNILQLLFNAVDVIVVGRFAGDDALAAVGATTSLISLLTKFFIGLSVGVTVLVSKDFAAKRGRQVSETVHTAIVIAGISGIVLTIIGMIGAPIFLRWMSTPKKLLDMSVLYVRTYFMGTCAMLLYNFGAAILRAVGDTKRPTIYLTIAGVVNALLNLFFVTVLHWGVAGVGIATAISQIISAMLVLRCLTQTESAIRLTIQTLHINKEKLIGILRVGVPAGIQSSLFNVANVTIQSSVNLFGETVIAGASASSNIGGFIHTALDSFTQASLTFTSQNMGAGKYKRLNRVLFTALGCSIMTGVIVGGGATLAGPFLLSLYTTSSAVVVAGMVKLEIVGISYIFNGIMNVFVGALRGMGHSVVPMVITLFGSCVFRIAWLQTIFRMERFHTIETVYYVYPVSWIVTTIMLIITYLIVRWKLKNQILQRA